MKDDQIVLVKNAEEAGRYLDKEIKSGDVVLIKGSQSSRMEKTVRDLLADPTKASELLVRQEPEWQQIFARGFIIFGSGFDVDGFWPWSFLVWGQVENQEFNQLTNS